MVEQLECAAVLDMKWSGSRLAVATAKGNLHIYAYRQGCGSGSVSRSGARRAKMTHKNRKKYRIFMF